MNVLAGEPFVNKVEAYLQIVPLPVLLLAPVAVILAWLLVPARLRLPCALAALVPWLTLGIMPGLGTLQSVGKATGFAAYVLVAVAAWLDPGPKRQMPLMIWLYPFTALLGFFYILTVSDLPLAFVLRLQWLLLVIAAMTVARTIVDEASLLRVVAALAIGATITMLLPLSDLLLNPTKALKAGMGRFFPYGANPNQIGIVFSIAGPLTLYLALRSRHAIWKPVLLGATTLAIGMGLLTASRSTMAVMLGPMIPVGWQLMRRASMAIVAAIIAIGGVFAILTIGSEANLGRLLKLETTRPEIALVYLELISERPLFGLLETEGESFIHATSEASTHPHNAYIVTLYIGGLSFALPTFLLVGYTVWCTFNVWRQRRRLSADPPLLNMLIVFMALVYLHGFEAGGIYYPTHAWAFFHVLLSTFFICLSSDLARVWDPFEVTHDEYEAIPEFSEATADEGTVVPAS